jgi:hypothetical protein
LRLPNTRIVAILAGADHFHQRSSFEPQSAFAESKEGFANYIRTRLHEGKDEGAILDLFNDPRHALAQVEEIERWLTQFDRNDWDTLIFYYVGHGMVNPRNDEFHMALFDTRSKYSYQSSLQASALALALADWSATKQIVMILDCCYAGAARIYMDENADPMQSFGSFMRTAKSNGKPRGVFQLCAAGKDFRALVVDGSRYTMFSGAMLHVLRNGNPKLGPTLDIMELRNEIEKYLTDFYPEDFVKPIVNLSEATDICSFFPNPSYRKYSASTKKSDVAKSVQQDPPKKVGPGSASPEVPVDRWRNPFSSAEIEFAVALGETFNPRLENVKAFKTKLAYESGDEREWLVCTRERLYRVLDRPSDVEPVLDVNWALDRGHDLKSRLSIEALRETKSHLVVGIGKSEQKLSKDLFFGSAPRKKLRRWIDDLRREPRPKEADILHTAGDLAVLARLRIFLDEDLPGPLPQSLRHDLTNEISEWGASGAMLLARMRRRKPRVAKKDSERLRPVFEALCDRPIEACSHRYWAQLAYITWCSTPASESKRIPLLDKAIALRGQLRGSKRFARYEATRAVSRILSDASYRAGRRSVEAVRAAIIADLKVAKPVIDTDLSADDLAEITTWLRRNGLKLRDVMQRRNTNPRK